MGQVHQIENYAYGVVQVSAGKHGRETWTRKQRVLVNRERGEAIALPRKRRIGRLGPAKVLDFTQPARSCDDQPTGCHWPNCHCHGIAEA